MGDERYISDGYIHIARMPFAVTERTDLLHPYWGLTQCILGDPRAGSVQQLSGLWNAPRQ
jgi:hypothetical protein